MIAGLAHLDLLDGFSRVVVDDGNGRLTLVVDEEHSVHSPDCVPVHAQRVLWIQKDQRLVLLHAHPLVGRAEFLVHSRGAAGGKAQREDARARQNSTVSLHDSSSLFILRLPLP